jgi:ABC-type lipoprotein release transport system permease subunit
MSALRTLTPLAWRNIWRNPRRTAITLIVVAAGMWSIIFFNSILVAWMESSKDGALRLLIHSGQIHAEAYLDDPSIERLMTPPEGTLLDRLNGPEVANWTTRLVLPGVIQSEYKTLGASIVGVDPEDETRISSIPGKIIEGRYVNALEDDAVVIGLHMAERLKTGLGRRVILMSLNTEGSMSEQSFDVVGIFDADKATEDLYVFSGRAAVQAFVGLENEIAQIAVELANDDARTGYFDGLREVAPDLDIRAWNELNMFLATTDSFMGVFIFIWLGVVFSLMAIGIVNTQLMAVFERSREFGLVRALGMKPGRVLMMVTIESALLIGLGVLLGIVLSLVTIWALYDGIDLSAFSAGLDLFQGAEVMYPRYHFDGLVTFSITIWFLGILVALWPARRASKCSPVEAMRRDT